MQLLDTKRQTELLFVLSEDPRYYRPHYYKLLINEYSYALIQCVNIQHVQLFKSMSIWFRTIIEFAEPTKVSGVGLQITSEHYECLHVYGKYNC